MTNEVGYIKNMIIYVGIMYVITLPTQYVYDQNNILIHEVEIISEMHTLMIRD